MPEAKQSDHKEQVTEQLEYFAKGTQYVKLLRAATLKDGIKAYSGEAKRELIAAYESRLPELKVVKFIPASGAASRMFRRVHEWVDQPKKFKSEIQNFFKEAEQLAFFEEWVAIADKKDIETFEGGLDSKVRWLRLLIEPDGLGLAQKPKGLIPFHQYEEVATPVRDHVEEGLEYAQGKDGLHLHFTISPEFEKAFEKEVKAAAKKFDDQGTVSYEFSVQDPATNTICVDKIGDPVVNDNGELIKRPGGHGALIHNLQNIDADLIFIKNIDNVSHRKLLPQTVMYKKMLGGVILDLQRDLKRLHAQVGKGLVDAVSIDQAREKWGVRIPRDYVKLKEFLRRPIRVCGMVKNEGEPGGGPFWCLDRYTGESLQIVEQSQVETKNMRQEMILSSSKYFNPVDIVCITKDLEGRKIDLQEYVDRDRFLVTSKTMDGKTVKVLEWPGLWNGGMAHWITVFIEVPIQTFNPVKEVTDLLKKEHLS